MQYKILKERSVEDLEFEVAKHFKLGFDLVGGLACYTKVDDLTRSRESPNPTIVWFCQAMIKSRI
jgi:hypothetical protein